MGLTTERVEAVRRFTAVVSGRSTQNLELLRAVDKTVDWLSGIRRGAEGDADLAHRFAELIKEGSSIRQIDPDRVMCGQLALATDACSRIIARLRGGLSSAQADAQLDFENRDCVVSEFDQTITVFESLKHALGDLRSVVEAHDSEFTETLGPFKDVEDLIEALDA